MVWKILGIEKTKNEDAIKSAYHEKLHYVNPEDDAEGFKELRRAYEEALEYAGQEEADPYSAKGGDFGVRKNEVDLWIDQIDTLYQDIRTRKDEKKWEVLLHDSICDDLDMELEAAEKLLVYFMSHSFLPQNIWQMVDSRFHYMDDYEQLKELFPENYLEYVKWQIESPNFIDFDLFDGKTDDKADDYISKLYEAKNASDDKDLNKLKQILKELSRYEIAHPYAKVEEAKYFLIKQEEESGEYAAEALSIMEELDFEYSDNLYIESIYADALLANGKIDKAKVIYTAQLEKSADSFRALLGQANCIFLEGDAEAAKEQIEDILEERVQDIECLALLDKINKELVKNYEAVLKEKQDKDICIKLGWCYYQQKEFKKGITLLDQLEEEEDYDYINLRCRLYLASDDYKSAYPLTKKWMKLIETSEVDGSKEMQKRKNRLSLAYFSIGVCTWEVLYKTELDNETRDLAFEKAVKFIKKAISEENNLLVKFSYMEQLARFYLEAEAYKECIEICDAVIKEDRGFFPAYVHRQKANYELKNGKEVIDDYFRCIEIYPEYIKPYVLAAEVFLVFEQYDDVESVIEAAKEAELKSDSLELYRIKCIHYKNFSKENVQQAIKEIEVLRERVRKKSGEEETDLKDLAELEKEYAILYWDCDDTAKALHIIDDYLKECSNNTTMLHLKADILKQAQSYEEALKICQLLTQLEPDDLFAKSKVGSCYEKMEELDKAIESYHMILDIDLEYVQALRRMMYIYDYLGNQNHDKEKCRMGIQYATRLIEATGSAEGYLERGSLNIDLYELENAVEDCKEAIKLDPEAYYAYNNLGCALLKLRKVEEAILPLEKAIDLDPDKDHLPYLNLAECYILQKEYDKAIHAYEEVLRLYPKASHIWEEIAKVYVMKGEYTKAVSIYQKLLNDAKQKIKEMKLQEKLNFYFVRRPTQENEKICSLYCKIADVYRQAGDDLKAKEYYKKVDSAKLTKLTSCQALEKAAEFYRDRGELKKAASTIMTAFQRMDAVDRYRYLDFIYASILFEMGKSKQAVKYAQRFIKLLLKQYGGEEKIMLSDRRYRPMHLYDMGIMNICAGNLEKGKEYLEQIRECHLCVTCETCDCFEYYFGMGLIAELQGKKEEAKSLYEKAIEIKGDYPCCERHLKNLLTSK